jgi:hypothetical protein
VIFLPAAGGAFAGALFLFLMVLPRHLEYRARRGYSNSWESKSRRDFLLVPALFFLFMFVVIATVGLLTHIVSGGVL